VLPFPAPSLPRQKVFPAQSRKFPALANRENFARTLKALRNLWVHFMKLPGKISNTLQISLIAGKSRFRDWFAVDCLVSQRVLVQNSLLPFKRAMKLGKRKAKAGAKASPPKKRGGT
jgi:hypothetical protein